MKRESRQGAGYFSDESDRLSDFRKKKNARFACMAMKKVEMLRTS